MSNLTTDIEGMRPAGVEATAVADAAETASQENVFGLFQARARKSDFLDV